MHNVSSTSKARNGEFLVLDFDGDHLKAVLVELQDRRVSVIKSERYAIPSNIQKGESKKLFGVIADHTNDFFTNSHFDNLGKLEVVAVVHDAVSTLMSVADKVPNCKIGLIVGNGLNACFVKDLTNVETDCPEDDKPIEMFVNTELGALGENGCLNFCRTDFDQLLDEKSNVPKGQLLEKMVGGRYIGELVRLVLEGLTKEGLLFRSVPSRDALFKRDSFSTELVFNIENDTEDTGEPNRHTAETLNGLGVTNFSQEDLQTVRHVCKAVCERAAFLTATSLATLINRIKQPEVTIVVDGYLYMRHPRFHDLMYSKTLELVKPELKFYLVSPRYERSIGAARIVAASLRSRDPQTVNV
ncbi:hexokinase type 2-like [Littorina saxatilis]|uniref:hexokinase type 2-like n=1 Tax=Littorina saxatilis TaxID=31220 RepID=UPI0038B52D54